MKAFQSLKVAMILLSLVFTFPSCSADDKNLPPTQEKNEVTVKIDGSSWTGSIGSIATSGGTTQLNSNNAIDNSGIKIFFPEDTTGIFDLTTSSLTVSYSEGNVFWSSPVSGTLSIDQNNAARISGTFSATLASFFNSDTITLTEGKFNYSF